MPEGSESIGDGGIQNLGKRKGDPDPARAFAMNIGDRTKDLFELISGDSTNVHAGNIRNRGTNGNERAGS